VTDAGKHTTVSPFICCWWLKSQEEWNISNKIHLIYFF